MKPVVLTRERRIKLFGVDCVSELLYSGWRPDGRVYTQKLVLKNVGSGLQTLTYMLPKVPNFFMPFPDPIVLPVGMEYAVTVSFQPTTTTELETYLAIFSTQANDTFYLRLTAELPTLSCAIEPHIDFTLNPTAVSESSSLITPLRNDGEVPFLFRFEAQGAFNVKPHTGVMQPGDQCPITFLFAPQEAGSFTGNIILEIKKTDPELPAKTDQLVKTITLGGISKYSFIRVSLADSSGNVCDFKETPIFATVQKTVYLENDSLVPFSFHIEPSWESTPQTDFTAVQEFSVEPRTGILQANARVALKVGYAPMTARPFNDTRPDYMVEKVVIKALSGVSSSFTIEASAIPPQLELSETKINLGVVHFGETATHMLQLKNLGKHPCPYEICAPFARSYTTPKSFADPISGKTRSAAELLDGTATLANTNLLIPETTDIGLMNRARPISRRLRDLPLAVTPESGVVPAGISITLTIVLDVRMFTSEVDVTRSNGKENTTFIPPYPIGGYLAVKVPSGSPLFILVTGSLIPERGVDIRPAPITINYYEIWKTLREKYTVDELFGPLIQKVGRDHQDLSLSPLYDECALPEFAIQEAMQSLKGIKQALVKRAADFEEGLIDRSPSFYTLPPNQSVMYELYGQFLANSKGGLGAKISMTAFDFGYVPFEGNAAGQAERPFYVFNESSEVDMVVGWTCSTIRGSFSVRFNGLTDSPEFDVNALFSIPPEGSEYAEIKEFVLNPGTVRPTVFAERDGVSLNICMLKGLVILVPPRTYAHFSLVCVPNQTESFFHSRFTAICSHTPLIQYRNMRHCVVGTPIHFSIDVTACSRLENKPALTSGMPEISPPVRQRNGHHHLLLSPTAPGRVTRTSFALTNTTETFMLLSLDKPDDFEAEHDITRTLLAVEPQIIALPPGGTRIVTVAVFFPSDAVTNKFKYSFLAYDRSSLGGCSTVLFSTWLRFKLNGSKETLITIQCGAVCSAPKLCLTTESGANTRLLISYLAQQAVDSEAHEPRSLGTCFMTKELMNRLALEKPQREEGSGQEEEGFNSPLVRLPANSGVGITVNPISIGSEVMHTCRMENCSAITYELHFDTSLYKDKHTGVSLLDVMEGTMIIPAHSTMEFNLRLFADQGILTLTSYSWPFKAYAIVPTELLPAIDFITALQTSDSYYHKVRALNEATTVPETFEPSIRPLWTELLNQYAVTPVTNIVRAFSTFGRHNPTFFTQGYTWERQAISALLADHPDCRYNECLRALSAALLVEGSLSALVQVTPRSVSLTPSIINMGPIMPDTAQELCFTLQNNSNCAVTFVIEIHETMSSFPYLPNFDSAETNLKRYLFEPASDGTECLVPSLLNLLTKDESVLTEAQALRCPSFFIRTGASGILHANAQADIGIVAVPRRTGLLKARIVVKVVELAGIVLSEEEIIKDLQKGCLYIQGLPRDILSVNPKQSESIFVSSIELKAECPKFFIADASCPKVGSSQLRDMLDVDSLNDFLLGDVTPAEHIYRKSALMREKLTSTVLHVEKNKNKGHGRVESSLDIINAISMTSNVEDSQAVHGNDLSDGTRLIRSFPVVLGPDNRQSEVSKYRVILSLANPYDLPVEITLSLPYSEPNLESCPWARTLPPKAEQRAMDLLSKGIFIVSPERIYLKPNEKRSLSITYVHSEEGVHELQVQVSITRGRIFILHLIGQTLGNDEPAILAPIEQKFLPVALGEIVSPRQVVKLTNPGQVGVNYVLLRPEMFRYDENGVLISSTDDGCCHGHREGEELVIEQGPDKILACLNPRGYIPPNSCTNIVFVFTPRCVGFAHFKIGLVIYPTNTPPKKTRPWSHGVRAGPNPSTPIPDTSRSAVLSPIAPRSVADSCIESEAPKADITTNGHELEAYYDANVLDIPDGELVGYGELDDNGLIDGVRPFTGNQLTEARRSSATSYIESRCISASSTGANRKSSGRPGSRSPNRLLSPLSARNQDNDSHIYQVIDLIGYGFIAGTHVSQEAYPSYALGTDPDSPGCGSVTIKSQDNKSMLLANTQTGVGLCSLSYGRMIFGALPCLGYTSTIVTLTGSMIGEQSLDPYLSQFRSGYYEWNTILPIHNPNIRITVTPMRGHLDPGQQQTILINIFTGSLPMVTIDDIGFSVCFHGEQVQNPRLNIFEIDAGENEQRLPVTLANTVASAARITEQAYEKGFNPQAITRAGIDVENRKHRAIFHGICLKGEGNEDISTPLSRYSTHPHDDILWLTFMCHSHRAADLEHYRHALWGLRLSRIACEMMEFGTVNMPTNDVNERYVDLTPSEAREIEQISNVTLRGVINRLCTEEIPKDILTKASLRTKRRVINGMSRANFASVEQDDPVSMLDSEDAKLKIRCADMLRALTSAIYGSTVTME
ncbi:hypothetical protein GMRT_12944 [Giardia muris]|uniref:MSP domain-containing protein n=1 Tax=Giardia muris TaxID=5742 RepID=A0A4Z1T511_GIAMU|nr:hypothetical protein GMRT_12944 [Giardia muris]|eukprot:TNJ29093.1 hypothetical protein GMRT_12944 [Giardia muris]